MAPFAAVIFDMDGTLIASTRADFVAWKKLFADRGIDLTYETYYYMLGKRSADIVHESLGLHGDAADDALTKKMLYFRDFMESEGIEKTPYAESLLREIKSIPLKIALATSSRRPKTEMVMKATGLLGYFDAIVTGDETIHGKPAPDIFLAAAAKLQVPPGACLVFEDSVSGIAAARAAGMKCIAITTTHHADQLRDADLVIDSFHKPYSALCAMLR